MKHLVRMSLLLAALVLVAADKELAPEKADVRGKITTVRESDAVAKKAGNLGSILIEGTKDKDTSYDKASVRITDKTKIEKIDGKEKKAAKFEDLKKGAKVQAVFTGPVAESYPVQATAKEVLILGEAK